MGSKDNKVDAMKVSDLEKPSPPNLSKEKEMESQTSYNMRSTESKQRLHEKIQKPPGSWLARKLKTMWYLTYGMMVLLIKLKPFRELFAKNKRYDAGSEPRRIGEVAVITGGPRGIAYELAKKLLQLDFIVIMGARDVNASQKKIDQMRERGVANGTIYLLPLNLKSLASTKEFAEKVLALTSRVDYLFNNAGIMMTPYECTEDGYEAQFQVNYLSHYLLTRLLLPTIKATALERGDSACRIVNTTSVYHHPGSLDFDDLETREVYAAPKCYYDSKLCQVLFTKQLEKRLQLEKANVHVYAVHPGAIPTDLWQSAGGVHKMLSCILKAIMPNTEDGADTLMYAALCSKLESKGGSYLEGLRLMQPNPQANNVFNQELLWSRSDFFVQALT